MKKITTGYVNSYGNIIILNNIFQRTIVKGCKAQFVALSTKTDPAVLFSPQFFFCLSSLFNGISSLLLA
jgi:hypothetical protein